MILGSKHIARRHTIVGIVAFFVTLFFWLTRPEWSPDMRLWRAFGDSAFIFLAVSLAIGPLTRLFTRAYRLLPWRREIGMWFAVLALIHGLLILNGWVTWDILRFLGYEYIPQAQRYIRLESGFGLANIMGVIALFWALILLATSSDRAVDFLGTSSWKWLHTGAYIIFYLTAIHIAYFMFMHYTVSFHRPVPPPNWFRFYSLLIVITVFFLQITAFIKTVRSQRKKDWY